MLDLLGNDLKEGDKICIKTTELSVGKIVKIQEEGGIGKVEGGVMLNVPGEVVIMVEVRMKAIPGTNVLTAIKAYEDRNKPRTN